MKTGKLVVAVLIILTGSLLAKSQTDPSLETGLKPYGSYHGGDIDSVNLSNGNLTLHIPLPDYSQRGSLTYGPHLTYNNKGWSVDPNCNSVTGICSPFWVWHGESVTLNSFYGGTGVPSSTWLSADQVFVDWEPAYKGSQIFLFTATTTDGSVHQLASLPGGGMLTIDGTDIWYDGSQPASHLQGIARNSQGIDVTNLKDTNGNFFTISNSTPGILTDTLGRVLPSPQSGGTADFSGCTGPLPIAGAGIDVFSGFNGGTTQIKYCYADVALQTNFQASAYFNQNTTAIAEHGVGAANNPMLQSVVLYNGVSWASSPAWTFEYDSRSPGDSSSVNYGDLTKITLPTGGTISYTWGTNGTCSAQTDTPTAPLSRVVTKRTVDANDGTGPHAWTYGGSGLVTDPNGNDTVHAFTYLNNSCSPYETTTKYFQGSSQSGQLLKTVDTHYRWIPNPFDKVNPNNTLTTVTQVFPDIITTTLPNGKVTKVEKDYDNNLQLRQLTGTYGNVIETREYDYGNGAPGPLLRRTDYTYKAFDGSPSSGAYLAANLVHLVSSVTVYDGNRNQVSSTTYGYDESALQPSAGSSSITTQHDTSIPNPGTRGNQTSVNRWLNTTAGTVTTKTAYYDTGTIYQVTDPKLNVTTNFYTTGFQSGSSFVGAYVTQVQNALQQNTYFDYDFNTGLRTALKDPNGQISSWDYDPLNRTRHANAPDGGSTRWDYTDTIPPSFTATSTITSSLNHVAEADLDGLGRLAHSKLNSDPAGVDTVDTTYDPLSRVASVSNPYRTTGDSTYGTKQTQYDALGRVTQVTEQDHSSFSPQYNLTSANSPNTDCTLSPDEAGKPRQTCTDALGRLIEVDEPPGVSGVSTSGDPTASIPLSGVLQVTNPPAGSVVEARADSPFVMAGVGDFYYLDIYGHVREATAVPNGDWAGWTNADITAATGAPVAASNSQLTAYRDSSSRTYVLYVTASEHLEVVYYNNGWFCEDLTTTYGNVLATSTTPIAMAGEGDFYYLDSNGHVREVNVSNGVWAGWSNFDVSATTGAAVAGASSRLTGYRDSAGRTYVLFVTAAQHLEVVYYNAGWAAEDLSSTFGNVLAASGTPIAMAGGGDFYYLDTNGQAHEATVSNGVWASWTNGNITAGTSAPAAASNSQLAGYRDSSGRTYVLYVTAGEHLEVLYYDNGWFSEDLTNTYLDVPATSSTPIVMAGAGDFYYLDTNGHAREAAVSNGVWANWTNADVTGTASAAGSSGGLIAARDASNRTYVLYANTGPDAEALWYDGYNWNNIDLGLLTAGAYDSGTISLTVGGFTVTVCYGHSSYPACDDQPINSTADEVAAAVAQAFNVSASPVAAVASGSIITVTWKTANASDLDISDLTVTHDQPGTFTAPSFSNTYTTFYSYDALGNLLSVNQKGDGGQPARVRNFTYDSLSRLTQAVNPESGTINYTYDANGNLLQKTSPAPNAPVGSSATQVISYCYDALNRVTGKAYSAQTCSNGQLPQGTAAVSYFYDQSNYQSLTIANGIGRLTGIADQAGSGAYSFDRLGRVQIEQRSIAGVTKSMSYTYNLDGSLNTLTNPSGAVITYTPESAGTNSSGRTGMVKDLGNNINYVSGTGGPSTFASYSPDGSLTGFASGASGSFAGITNSFSYNNRLQPVTMSAVSPASTVFSLTYNFNFGAGDNGNVIGITNNKDSTRSQSFTYDSLNRLTSAQNAGTNCSATTVNGKTEYWGNSYGYDAWGNLQQKTVTKCSAENLAVTADVHNQIHATGGSDYRYDAAGNMTYDPTDGVTATYDPENRITGAGGYTYTYDADGDRVEKSGGGAGTLYWYMSPGIVAESDLSGNLKSEYVFFDGERVARRDGPNGSGGVFYYFSDHLKTTDIVTNATGTILNESDFYPWGGELELSANDSNHYKFTGKERDTETGLDYFGARYYSNGVGRFITPDWAAKATAVPYAEFADPQSLNLYTYVRNVPTTRFDADGHQDAIAIGAEIGTLIEPGAGTAIGAGVGVIVDAGLGVVALCKYLKSQMSPYGNRLTGTHRTAPKPSKGSPAPGTQAKPKVPNPNGRNGGPEHQAKVKEIEDGMKDKGLQTDREHWVPTPEGEKSGRFIDVVGIDPVTGEVVEQHQVGKQTQDGDPVAREQRALDDINQATGKDTEFHPYNGPNNGPKEPK